MRSLSTRLQGWLRDEIVEFWERHRAGPSEALRQVAREWWAMQEFPSVEFREGIAGRRAGLRGGPDIWEVIMVWQEYAPDRDAFHEHFGGSLSPESLDQALSYYARFPEEIDHRIAENRRIAEHLESGAANR